MKLVIYCDVDGGLSRLASAAQMRKFFFFRSSQDSSTATNGKVHKETLKHVGEVVNDVSEVEGSRCLKDSIPRQDLSNFESGESNWSRDIIESPVGRNHLDDQSNWQVLSILM